MQIRPHHDFAARQRADRADRIVAAGVFIAFLLTGIVGEDAVPERQPVAAARTAQHAPR